MPIVVAAIWDRMDGVDDPHFGLPHAYAWGSGLGGANWQRTGGFVGGLREDGPMPLTLITGPANAGKARLAMEAVRVHLARDEDPLLVVPTEADQARYRRELAQTGLTLGVRVERFQGLFSEVLARAAPAQPRACPPLGNLARERVLARLAGARPGTARELARFLAELETQRITPARLRGALRAWSSSATPQEPATLDRLSQVFERYHQALAKMGRSDREQRLTGALDELRRKPALWGSLPVILYGFDDLTELQLDAIETLCGVVGAPVTLSLAFEPGRLAFAGRAATFQRLAPLARTHTELPPRAEYYVPASRKALHHLERSLLGEETMPLPPGEAVRLLEGGSPRAEFELVAGEIRALLDAAVPAAEIAITHRFPDTIAGLLGEVLHDFDIPHALPGLPRFADTAIGRGLLGRCAVRSGTASSPDLLAWLRAPGMLQRPELADRLEATARRQGALHGARARELWEAEHWPLDRLDRLDEAARQGAPALLDALAAELQRLFCAPRARLAPVLANDELRRGTRSARRATCHRATARPRARRPVSGSHPG